MKGLTRVCRNGTAIACCVFFLSSCSTSAEKTTLRLHFVEIRSMQFRPADLLVQKGDTVVFTNNDVLVHDVTEEKDKAWSSSPLSTGEAYRLTVSESADYYCSIHPVMKGKLRVQ